MPMRCSIAEVHSPRNNVSFLFGGDSMEATKAEERGMPVAIHRFI